jgi:tripartite-type tricarboxylate transporter receptor subunit TctC
MGCSSLKNVNGRSSNRCGAPCVALCVALCLGASLAGAGANEAYPTKPVRVIVAVPAGGTPDVVARMVAPGMAAQLGQQLVIDNRGGAGGRIGTELASRAAADGYTILVTSSGPLSILPYVQRDVPYDPVKDFSPISLIATNPFLLVAHTSVPAKTVQELVALARAEPGRLNYASAGNGTTNHLAFELFKHLAGVRITHVPYKGAPQAVTDLVGGHANLMLNSIAPVLPHIRAGRLRLLGVSSAKRSPQLPEAPTLAESGVAGYEMITWFGLVAPAGAPKPVIARLSTALLQGLATPEIRAQMGAQGVDPVGDTPEAFAAFIRRESAKYANLVKVSGARVD